MTKATVVPDARGIHASILARHPEGITMDRDKWDSLLALTLEKSKDRCDVITRTGEAMHLWKRVDNGKRVSIRPAPSQASGQGAAVPA